MENIILNSFLPMLFSSGGFADFFIWFGLWFFALVPQIWIITFPICLVANYFLIDIAAEKCNYIFENRKEYHKLVIKSTILCFIFDLLLSVFILSTLFYLPNIVKYIVGENFKNYENMIDALYLNPLSNFGAFFIMCLFVFVVKSVHYLVYLHFIVKKLDIDEGKKKKFALYTVIFTIPYYYFLPSNWLAFK